MRKALITILPIACSAWTAAGADKSGSTTISVVIRPEAAMTIGAATADVRIRLNSQTQGMFWRDRACGTPGTAVYTISESGSYTVALDAIPGEGDLICLHASDGSLTREWRVSTAAR